METGVLIAQIMGPIMMIVTLAAMLNQKNFDKVLNEISNSNASVYFVSLLRLTLWFIIILLHNNWDGIINIMISIIAWIILVAGVTGLIFPEKVMKFAKPVIKNKRVIQTCMTIIFVLGAALVYLGFGGM